MWYVVQVYTGKEKMIVELCQNMIDRTVLKDCFCPQYESIHKKNGVRKTITKILFPGYVFLDTDDVLRVYEQLRQVPEFAKILRTGEDIVALSQQEVEFIMRHGNAEHIFEMSRGYMVGDYVVIEEGAFQGYSGSLKYVDRHNRYGIIEVEMFGRLQEIRFGLEIVRKN